MWGVEVDAGRRASLEICAQTTFLGGPIMTGADLSTQTEAQGPHDAVDDALFAPKTLGPVYPLPVSRSNGRWASIRPKKKAPRTGPLKRTRSAPR